MAGKGGSSSQGTGNSGGGSTSNAGASSNAGTGSGGGGGGYTSQPGDRGVNSLGNTWNNTGEGSYRYDNQGTDVGGFKYYYQNSDGSTYGGYGGPKGSGGVYHPPASKK